MTRTLPFGKRSCDAGVRLRLRDVGRGRHRHAPAAIDGQELRLRERALVARSARAATTPTRDPRRRALNAPRRLLFRERSVNPCPPKPGKITSTSWSCARPHGSERGRACRGPQPSPGSGASSSTSLAKLRRVQPMEPLRQCALHFRRDVRRPHVRPAGARVLDLVREDGAQGRANERTLRRAERGFEHTACDRLVDATHRDDVEGRVHGAGRRRERGDVQRRGVRPDRRVASVP